MRRFSDTNVVVTGGSSGIGRAVVLSFAREGATVVAWGRDAGRLAAVREESAAIVDAGPVETVAVDLRDLAHVRACLRTDIARLGASTYSSTAPGSASSRACSR